MFGSRLLTLTLLGGVLGACSKDNVAPAEPASAGEGGAVMTRALTEALRDMEGRLGEVAQVKETLERQTKKLKGARVDRVLPLKSLDGAAIRDVLTSYAKMHGLGDVTLKFGAADQGKALPERADLTTPIAYETKHLIGSVPVAITLNSNDEERLKAYFKAMVKLQIPLMVIPTMLIQGETATFSGTAYFRREVNAPPRGAPTPPLEEMARVRGVSLPSDAAQLEALRGLYAQLNAKRARVAALMVDKDTVARQGRVLHFLRNKAREIDSQSVPKTVRAPSTPGAAP